MLTVLDCTLRDGGYYTNWDFPREIVNEYLVAMDAAGVDVVEIGFRGFEKNQGFKGASAYSRDDYLGSLKIPQNLNIAVMVNASEILRNSLGVQAAIDSLFVSSEKSPVDMVRIACHANEFDQSLEICSLLKRLGYQVGLNLMQITSIDIEEISLLVSKAKTDEVDVLYFADSLGCLSSPEISEIVTAISRGWSGPVGIHAHDNMGNALSNSLEAIAEGATWVDCTVSGMGRGPGNTQTEFLILELAEQLKRSSNYIPLIEILEKYFVPLKNRCAWGTNPFYYLAGQHGIHPTYIQEMLSDSRYEVSDILDAIERLKGDSGNRFDPDVLEGSRNNYSEAPSGTWAPAQTFGGREVLLIGAGPGVATYRDAIELFIAKRNPYVIALNTVSTVSEQLVDLRVGCHPVRLLADVEKHQKLVQPLAVPVSNLSPTFSLSLAGKELRNFGLSVRKNIFQFQSKYAVIPNSLVLSYALAIATSGNAKHIFLAGFDGHQPGDSRNNEVESTFEDYFKSSGAVGITSLTPTIFGVPQASVYSF